MRRDLLLRLGPVICMISLLGCGGPNDEWPRVEVEGTVTLDGQPLPTGQITFFPTGSIRGPAGGGEIVDGRFHIPIETGPVAGPNRIEIRSVQKTGRQVKSTVAIEGDANYVDGQLVDEYADVVPSKYNRQSTLTKELVEGEVNHCEFALSTSAK